MPRKFVIVEFSEEGSCEWIPSCWMSGRKYCFWPPVKECEVNEMRVKLREPVADVWERHKIRILGWADKVEDAKEKAVVAENSSDLNSDADRDKSRKRKAPSRFGFETDSESHENEPHLKELQELEPESNHSLNWPSLPPPSSSLHQLSLSKNVGSSSSASTMFGSSSSASTMVGSSASASASTIVGSSSSASTMEVPSLQETDLTKSHHHHKYGPHQRSETTSSVKQHSIDLDTETSDKSPIERLTETIIQFKHECRDAWREIYFRLDNIEKRLDNLQPPLVLDTKTLDSTDDFFHQITSLEDFERFTEDIKKSEELSSSLVRFFVRKRDANCRQTVARCLNSIMKNEMQCKVNRHGTHGKKKLDVVEKAIKDSFRKMRGLETTPDADIEMAIKRHLKNAADRDGGRRTRNNIKSPNK